MTIRLAAIDFLWVVHCNHASIWHRYKGMTPQMLDAQTWKRKERRKKRRKKGKGKEQGLEKGERKGKWGRKKGKKKEKGRGRKSEKKRRKGMGRWKKDSLRKVGRTDVRSGDFILCPMLLHCIGQTKKLQHHEANTCSY